MNYKLAKELKDAGFPQENSYDECGSFVDNHNVERFGNELAEEFNPCKIPTLLELIKAFPIDCSFSLSRRGETSWGAIVNDKHSGMIVERYGNTPEEAVAKLWLGI